MKILKKLRTPSHNDVTLKLSFFNIPSSNYAKFGKKLEGKWI